MIAKTNRKQNGSIAQPSVIWNDLGSFPLSKGLSDKTVAFFLAWVLLFSHFKGVLSYPLSTVIMIIFLPFILYKLCSRCIRVNSSILALLFFMLYRILMHGTSITEIAVSFLVLAYAVASANGMINIKVFLNTILAISCANAAVIIFQTIAYHFAGLHINFIPSALLTEEILRQAQLQISTGISSGIYRPSGFFNEPSHFIQFVLPCLVYLILSPTVVKRKFIYAIFVTFGIVCSTSGSGIGIAFALWGFALLRKVFQKNVKCFIWGLVGVIALLLFFLVLYNTVPVFRESVLRIFGMSSVGTGALRGRLIGGSNMVDYLSRQQFLFGTGELLLDTDIYLSGMYRIILTVGAVGLGLYWLVYLIAAMNLQNVFRYFTILEALLLIAAGTYTVQSMVYIFIFAFSGFYIRHNDCT